MYKVVWRWYDDSSAWPQETTAGGPYDTLREARTEYKRIRLDNPDETRSLFLIDGDNNILEGRWKRG